MAKISPLALVDCSARLDADVEVGPFCTVGPNVTMASGCRLISHVVIDGHSTIGAGNIFHPHCTIGAIPQDKKFRGEKTSLVIGSNNIIREAVTIHIGTAGGGGITRVGNNNLLMVNCHIGHDCQIGDNCVLANNVMLAGHIVVGNNVWMSGASASHHYVSIGDFAFIAGMARIHHDVPPFMKVSDDDKIRAVNSEGMRRAGIAADDIERIEGAARRLFFNRGKQPFAAALGDFETLNGQHPKVKLLVEFLHRRTAGKHGRHLEGLRPRREKN